MFTSVMYILKKHCRVVVEFFYVERADSRPLSRLMVRYIIKVPPLLFLWVS